MSDVKFPSGCSGIMKAHDGIAGAEAVPETLPKAPPEEPPETHLVARPDALPEELPEALLEVAPEVYFYFYQKRCQEEEKRGPVYVGYRGGPALEKK